MIKLRGSYTRYSDGIACKFFGNFSAKISRWEAHVWLETDTPKDVHRDPHAYVSGFLVDLPGIHKDVLRDVSVQQIEASIEELDASTFA